MNKTDERKLEQIFEQYGRLMYYIAYQILKDEFRAEDAVQEAFPSW